MTFVFPIGIRIQQAGTEEGTISVSGATVSYNAFTGSHYAWMDASEIETGMLVSMTGVNRNLHDKPSSEVLYGVSATAAPNDPRVLGAYLSLLEPSQSASPHNPHLVMAVGNGVMWVVDTGLDIAPGDPLISSGVPGHAMRSRGSLRAGPF